MSRGRWALIGLAAWAGSFAMAVPAAHAEGCSPCTQPPPQGPVVLGIQQSTPPPVVAAVTAKAPTSTLPFTGADVAELTVIGGLAIAGGAVLVRSARRRTEGATS